MNLGMPGYRTGSEDESDLLIEDMRSMLYSPKKRYAAATVDDLPQMPPHARSVYTALARDANLQRDVLDFLFREGKLTKADLVIRLGVRQESVQMALSRLKDKGAVENTKDGGGFAHWYLI